MWTTRVGLACGRYLPLSIVSQRSRLAYAKRESTDEHDTDAPSFDRGLSAAADTTGSFQYGRSGHASSGTVAASGTAGRDEHPNHAGAGRTEAEGSAAVGPETEGRGEAGQEGRCETSESEEGEEEDEEAGREGRFPALG
jgi:hypothetical protein